MRGGGGPLPKTLPVELQKSDQTGEETTSKYLLEAQAV